MSSYPDGFLFGAATSSYQIEGAVTADGRGESVWDRFASTPGATRNGDTGSVACDHYHRWKDDIALMSELGLNAYRFSIAWPRILPAGDAPINQAGLDFYRALVDELLDAGITPMATLYHWDHPQALEDRGGWRSRMMVDAFARYADVVGSALGDRVDLWLTHNEPWVVAHLGHRTGQHAPGLVDSGTELDVAHHLMLGHGLATQALRARRSDLRVGIALNCEPRPPRSAHPSDAAMSELEQGLLNEWFLDPLTGRGYTEALVDRTSWEGAVVADGDLDVIAQPLDHIGLNYYRVETVWDPTVDDRDRPAPLRLDPEERSEMGWPVVPEGLLEMLRMLDDRAVPSISVTENGGAFPDVVGANGSVQDHDRIAYHERHLAVVEAAIAEGIPVDGYFAWSLLDNFEWSFGYDRRFGIVHVDFETQARTPKASAKWFADYIARHAH